MKKLLLFLLFSISLISFSSAQQTIRVVTAIYEPFVYYDEKGNLTGFDIELLNEICERLGVKYSIEVVSFQDIFTKLSNDEADIAIGAIYVTEERKKIVNYTDYYLETGLVFVINSDDEFNKDLSNKKIGVKKKATGEILAKKYSEKFQNCQVISFDSTEASFDALIEKKVDVVLNDFLNTNWLMFKKYRGKIVIPRNILDIPISLTKDRVAFPVNKKRVDLLQKFNEVLVQLKKEGYIDKLLNANPYIPNYPNLLKRIVLLLLLSFLLLIVVILFYRNIKNREKFQMLLVEEMKLKNILNNFPNLIILHNDKGEILYLNKKIEEFGFRIGENLFSFFEKNFVKEDQKELVKKMYEKLFKELKPVELSDIWAIDKENNYKILEIRANYFEDYDKKRRYLSFIQDETYIKEMESQFLQMQKLESIGRLAAGISHDFNNSLSAILGFAELSKLKIDKKEEVEKNLNRIIESVERASNMVKKLLAFSKSQVIQPKKLNINDFIINMKEVFEKLVGEDIKIETNLQSDIWIVEMDPSQFEQILINLIINARDAMPKGGKINITTKNLYIDDILKSSHLMLEEGEYVKLVIEDNGVGMSEEVKNRVFEPFFTTKKDKGGTGLGLSTVYGIVKQNKGEIIISSKVGVGTAVSIYLPASKAVAEKCINGTKKKSKERSNIKILLVEDDNMIRESVSAMLKELGFCVVIAENGKEGLKCYKENGDISLIITDIVMPEMSGIDMLNEITKLNPDIKCIFITGYSNQVIDEKFIISGRKNILNKPFSIDNLCEKLDEILNT